MSKGNGTCNNRNALILDDNSGNINYIEEPQMQDNSSKLKRIAEENNISKLELLLKNNNSYLEHLLAYKQLEFLKKNKEYDLRFEFQNLEDITKDLYKHPHQARAIFAKNTLFKDHLLYVSCTDKNQQSTPKFIFSAVLSEKLFYSDTYIPYNYKPFIITQIIEPLNHLIKTEDSIKQEDLDKIFNSFNKKGLDDNQNNYVREVFENKLAKLSKSHEIKTLYYINKNFTQASFKSLINKINDQVQEFYYSIKNNIIKRPIEIKNNDLSNQSIMKHIVSAQNNLEKDYRALSKTEQLKLMKWIKSSEIIKKEETTYTFKEKAENYEYNFFTDINFKNEDKIKKLLFEKGAKVTNNDMHIPTYASWATVEPGKRISLTLDNGDKLHYVPHGSVGNKEVIKYKNVISLPTISIDEINELNNKVDQKIKEYSFGLDQIYITKEVYTNDDHETKVKINALPKQSKEVQENVLEAIRTGKPILRGKGKHYEREVFTRQATLEDVKKYSKYMAMIDEDTFMDPRMLRKYKKIKKENLGLKEFLSSQKIKSVTNNKIDSKQSIIDAINNLELSDYHKSLLLNKIDEAEVTTEAIKSYLDIPHNAPNSERGIFRVETINPTNTLENLQELGLIGDLEEEVPYNLLYATKNRHGRINPHHVDYIENNPVQIPEDHMVLHGMTGTNNDQAAIDRLDKIINLGGLKSISERRRLNMIIHSLSPKGDIASGIDMGVSAKIGSAPYFGTDHIVFGMKQDILKRRDLWFANKDFGGGHNRYDEYNAYAKSIGQKHFYAPPSDKSRTKHYKSGLKEANNEVYFKHEINWNEIDVLFVNTNIIKQVKNRVAKAKEKGLIPQDLKIVSFNPGAYGDDHINNIVASHATEHNKSIKYTNKNNLKNKDSKSNKEQISNNEVVKEELDDMAVTLKKMKSTLMSKKSKLEEEIDLDEFKFINKYYHENQKKTSKTNKESDKPSKSIEDDLLELDSINEFIKENKEYIENLEDKQFKYQN